MLRVSIIVIILIFSLHVPVLSAARDLIRVGSGSISYLGMIPVYDAVLRASPGATRGQIQQAAASFCLEFKYHIELQPARFIKAAETILERQHDPHTLARYREQIDLLHASYRPVSEGDRYRLCFSAPLENTRMILNDRELVTVPGTGFAALYAGIWLADTAPLDRRLQRKLFGPLKGTQP